MVAGEAFEQAEHFVLGVLGVYSIQDYGSIFAPQTRCITSQATIDDMKE